MVSQNLPQTLIGLPQLTAFLDGITPKQFSGSTVEEFFHGHALNYDDLLPFIYFREDSYGRNVVHRSARYELLALSWLPNQSTPIHDHQGHRCWIWMHSGELSLQKFALPSTRQIVPLPKPSGPAVTLAPGEFGAFCSKDDRHGLHTLTNLTKRPAVSLHLYAEPMTQCRIFDPINQRFEMVELTAFNHLEIADRPPPGAGNEYEGPPH